jgi:hypothetical protein
LADKHGIDVKYGGGPDAIRDVLLRVAEFVARVEAIARVEGLRNSPEYLRLCRDIEQLLHVMSI